MSTTLRDLVSALPEVYQNIYGEEEWDDVVSRNCNERMVVLEQLYYSLSRALGRPLRILDLGCAQGFFSLSLARLGAEVHGVDFLKENIDVCNALAQKYEELNVRFTVGRVEEIARQIEPGQYDLVIGLSVFHHIIHVHGVEQVKSWLQKLADCVSVMVLELALREEPYYWGPSQAASPRELLESCAFVHEISRFKTHLSDIARPLYIVSNAFVLFADFCASFDHWTTHPYNGVDNLREGSRRYYFGKDFICKLYQFSSPLLQISLQTQQLNIDELRQEQLFLSSPPDGFTAPALMAAGENAYEGWLVMERFAGELLLYKLSRNVKMNVERIVQQLLEQLVSLENAGLYHNDVRSWNILIDEQENARLIDFGSISDNPSDCVWPVNLFQSFLILINEIILKYESQAVLFRSVFLSPFHLPRPYSNWLYAFWQKPITDWSFALLYDLFQNKEQLPSISLTASELWISAQESMLMLTQNKMMQMQAARELVTKQMEQQAQKIEELGMKVSLLEQRIQPHVTRRASLRYLLLQVRLLKQEGISIRLKYGVKKIGRKLLRVLYKMPILRRMGKYGIKKLGLYPVAVRIYERLGLGYSSSLANGHSANPLDLMPSVVKRIFCDLTGNQQGK
ncbi:MAG: class I SAM-dependent methyltransferase [Legionella sp.]|uniref:methyltransferase domain-containing protein n=1 Tax=Legionella sp. TaxID=459 RepID=UPI0039E50A96